MDILNDSDKKLSLILLNYILNSKINRDKQYNYRVCDLGMDLILSAVQEEERLACLLQRESKKINKVIERFKKNPHIKINTKDLIRANRCVKAKLRYIALVEEKIIKKVNKGKELVFCEDACSPIINPLDDTCENINNILVLALILIILLGNSCCSKEDVFTFIFLLMILVINRVK
jgi:hypothetical protein